MQIVRRWTCFAGVSIFVVSLFARVVAAETTADVTDSSGKTVRLTDVITSSFDFNVNDARMKIPVAAIRQIEAFGCDGRLKVTLVTRATATGTSESRISGRWELGTFSLDLSKVKRIDFAHVRRPRSKALVNGRLVYDLRCDFLFFGHGRESVEEAGGDPSLRLPVVIGDALYLIPFSEIEYAIPPIINLTGRPTYDGISFGRSRVLHGAAGKLRGDTEFGAWEMSLDKVAKIQFLREPDASAVASQEETNDERREPDCCDGISATITTRRGDVIPVTGLAVLTTNSRGHRDAASSRVPCRMGDSGRGVELSELMGIHDFTVTREMYNAYSWKLRIAASLVAHDGSPNAAELENPDIYFAGVAELGYVVIRARDVARIDIH